MIERILYVNPDRWAAFQEDLKGHVFALEVYGKASPEDFIPWLYGYPTEEKYHDWATGKPAKIRVTIEEVGG